MAGDSHARTELEVSDLKPIEIINNQYTVVRYSPLQRPPSPGGESRRKLKSGGGDPERRKDEASSRRPRNQPVVGAVAEGGQDHQFGQGWVGSNFPGSTKQQSSERAQEREVKISSGQWG